jgi:hypothetical protein
MEKVVILLTDGTNEWYDWGGPKGSSGDASTSCGESSSQLPLGGLPGANNAKNSICSNLRSEYPGADYTAYGRLSEGRLGTTSNSAVDDAIDDRMLDMCTAMKDEDIIIYTITFGSSPNATTQTLFRNCASEDDLYFHAPSNSTLQQIFVQIAGELSNLRIAE